VIKTCCEKDNLVRNISTTMTQNFLVKIYFLFQNYKKSKY